MCVYVAYAIWRDGLWCIKELYTTSEINGSVQLSHEGVTARHRRVNGMLDKFQRTFICTFCDKIHRFVERCYVYLTKERSIKAKMGPHMPSTDGNEGENLFIDFEILSETIRKHCYLLTLQDGLKQFAIQFVIKRRVLICEYFSIFRLPNQIHLPVWLIRQWFLQVKDRPHFALHLDLKLHFQNTG